MLLNPYVPWRYARMRRRGLACSKGGKRVCSTMGSLTAPIWLHTSIIVGAFAMIRKSCQRSLHLFLAQLSHDHGTCLLHHQTSAAAGM